MRFRPSFTSIHPHMPTHIIGPTWCKTQDVRKPVLPSATRSRIHVEYHVQVGCYPFHLDLKLPIYSTRLPTAYRHHLHRGIPLLFIIMISSVPDPQLMAAQRPQQGASGYE